MVTRRLSALSACALAGVIAITALSVAHGQDSGIRINIAGVTELEYPDAQAVVNLEDTSGASLGSLGASNFTVDGRWHTDARIKR